MPCDGDGDGEEGKLNERIGEASLVEACKELVASLEEEVDNVPVVKVDIVLPGDDGEER